MQKFVSDTRATLTAPTQAMAQLVRRSVARPLNHLRQMEPAQLALGCVYTALGATLGTMVAVASVDRLLANGAEKGVATALTRYQVARASDVQLRQLGMQEFTNSLSGSHGHFQVLAVSTGVNNQRCYEVEMSGGHALGLVSRPVAGTKGRLFETSTFRQVCP